MAGKSGITPLWNKSDIRKLLDKLGDKTEFIILDLLHRAGEEFVKIARLDGQYNDHTGNLRSSIGYVILKNGVVVDKNFQLSVKIGTDKETGKRVAEQFALEIASTYTKGYVLIGLAGMKYAARVEAIENKDVISRAADRSEDYIREMGQILFKNLSI